MEYASRAVGNAALTTGIIGTTLGVLDGMGGIAGILGSNRNPPASEDKHVTRYEMGLIRESIAKDNEIALLKAQQYTDHVNAGVQGQIAGQNAWNAAQAVNIQNLQNLLGQIAKPFVPNIALAPGYGPVEVVPATVVKAASTGATASSNG